MRQAAAALDSHANSHYSIQCSAQNVAQLCIGRVIAGVAIGIASSIVPVYQAEIAPQEIRGRVVSLQQWAITW